MNASLPSGIEHSLREAGFSPTELLVLRHLVEADALTVREIASKTGKSTGVLDQSVKKLIGKRIVERTIINGQPRYRIGSLDAILRWMRQDLQERQQSLERQHQSLQQFLATLKVDRGRPDMEYFQGFKGMEQAYLRLLETGGELLTTMPILTTAEDDPLRAFRVDYFRKRQYRKIFQRVIAPDTSLARRFQSRDHFEYRKTVLIPPAEFPLSFEKTVVGDTVACMNVQEQSGSFIRYPALANAERAAFEAIWCRATDPSLSVDTAGPSLTPFIPAKTRVLSSLREFVLSRSSIAGFIIFGLLSAAMTAGLYVNARSLNLLRVRSTVTAIAATGALQFPAADVDAVRTREDITKPAYARIVATLNLIRRHNPDIQYAYLMRKTDDPDTLAFVADADSLYPTRKLDLNGDGHIDDADQLVSPGDTYDVSRFPDIVAGFRHPTADAQPAQDQWGTFISGAAPITDKTGKSVALLGVDMAASELDRLTPQSLIPLGIFAGMALLFLVIRFSAVNRSLLREAFRSLNVRRALITGILALLAMGGIAYGFHRYTRSIVIDQTGERLMAVATLAAQEIDPRDLDELHMAGDMRKDAYQRVFRTLNAIRNENPEVKYAYILRPTDQPSLFQFIADADSNVTLPFIWSPGKPSEDLTATDENVAPGVFYVDTEATFFRKAMYVPAYGMGNDKWGEFISGAAPILDKHANVIGILGLDTEL
jgi:DNA-binding MarR family transcriptional regulator